MITIQAEKYINLSFAFLLSIDGINYIKLFYPLQLKPIIYQIIPYTQFILA